MLWLPIVFNASTRVPKEEVEQRRVELESLGIRVARNKQVRADTTHFVTPSVLPTVALVHALVLAAPIVTMAYVDEVARRATLPATDEDSLERRFELPNAEDYFPDERQIEDMTWQGIKVAFAVSQRRKTLLLGTTLLLMHTDAGLSKVSLPRSDPVINLTLYPLHLQSLEQTVAPSKAAGARISYGDISQMVSDEALLRFLRRNKSEAQTFLAECGEGASEAPDEGLVVLCASEDMESRWCERVRTMTRR